MCRALLYLGEPVSCWTTFSSSPIPRSVRQSLHAENAQPAEPGRVWPARLGSPREQRPQRSPFNYYSPQLPVFDRNLKHLAEKIRPPAASLMSVAWPIPHARRDLAAEPATRSISSNVPLVLAHNGDLAGFAEIKKLPAREIRPVFLPRRSTAPPTASGSMRSWCRSSRSHRQAAEEDQLARYHRTHRHHPLDARKKLGITISSSLNLFIADGSQIAAARYCFDFGRYPDRGCGAPARGEPELPQPLVHRGRHDGLHDGEWKMTGPAAPPPSSWPRSR